MYRGGGGGLYKLEFLHFKFCTKSLYAICSVFLRICAGSNGKHPLFLKSKYWEACIICSLIFKKWHGFCRARICRFIFPPARNIPTPGRPYCQEMTTSIRAFGGLRKQLLGGGWDRCVTPLQRSVGQIAGPKRRACLSTCGQQNNGHLWSIPGRHHQRSFPPPTIPGQGACVKGGGDVHIPSRRCAFQTWRAKTTMNDHTATEAAGTEVARHFLVGSCTSLLGCFRVRRLW